MGGSASGLTTRQLGKAGVFLYALVVLTAGFGLRDPWPPDEPRFALIAKEMAEGGHWQFPRIAGELYSDKPPLFFWLVAGLYLVTGSLRVALFTPALAAALTTLTLVWDLARRLWGPAVGVHAAWALALTVQFAAEARDGQIDGFLVGLTTLSLYGLLRHLLLGPAWGWWVVGWMAAGAGVLTKGVGFLPLLVLLPWAVWGRRGSGGGGWHWALGPLAFVAVVGAWLGPLLLAVAERGEPALTAYRDDLLLRQTVTRYADAWHHRHPPWYFLLNVIPVLWAPLAWLVPWLLERWRGAWRSREAKVLLPLVWMLLVLVFFSASPGKRGVYILPALPALVLAAAPWLEEVVRLAGAQRLLRGLLAVIGGVLAVAAAWVHWWPQPEAVRLEGALGVPLWVVAGAAAGVFLLAAWFARKGRALAAWIGANLLVWLGLGWGVLPWVDPERSGAAFMAEVRAALPPGGELGLVGWKEQFVLQARMPVTDFGFRRRDKERELAEALAWAAASPSRRLLVAEDHPGFQLAPGAAGLDLGVRHRQRWWLVGASDLTMATEDNLSPGR